MKICYRAVLGNDCDDPIGPRPDCVRHAWQIYRIARRDGVPEVIGINLHDYTRYRAVITVAVVLVLFTRLILIGRISPAAAVMFTTESS